MYREPKNGKVFCNARFDNGGIGDSVARLPAIQFILDHHPYMHLHLWVPDYFKDFAKRSLNPAPVIRGYGEIDKYKMGNMIGFAHLYPMISNFATHMTDNAFASLLNQQVENKFKNYLPVRFDDIDIATFNLPEKFAVVCTGYTAPVRQFIPEHVNGITSYLNKKGVTPVFLGNRQQSNGFKGNEYIINATFVSEIDYNAGINLIEKTTLVEVAKICAQAQVVIGLDNGILHIAATSDVPIVGGFTSVSPFHRLPYRHNEMGWNFYTVVPPDSLKCRFCQSNMVFEVGHTFTQCFYNDNKCTKEIQLDHYLNHLEKIL